MPESIKKKLRRTTIIYWSLLLYVVAALIWWLISLQQQNRLITQEKIELLQLQTSQLTAQQRLTEQLAIENLFERNQTKYISE